MPFEHFRFNNRHTVGFSITLVAGNTQILKLDGKKVGHEVAPYGVGLGCVCCDLTITAGNKNSKQVEKTFILEVSRNCVSKSYYLLHATTPKGAPGALPVCPVLIIMLPKLTLPPMNTDVGLLVRLLLAEALSPLYPDYGNGAAARESMDLMRQVLDNRVFASSTNLGPLINLVPKNASLRDIIFAPNQIEGFQGGTVSRNALNTIDGLMKIANDGTHRNFKAVRAHVEYALVVAKRSARSPGQITTQTLTHWRTKGEKNDAPSRNTVVAKDVAGQRFWTLSEEFLKANKP